MIPVEDVVHHAAASGLEGIEWAGDAHVPHGDLDAATHARTLTEQAGLAVTSYGSYLSFVGSDEEVRTEGQAVIAAARALGAPRIRVWATRTGSAETGADERARTVGRLQEFADRAAAHGLEIGLEFHGRTLTDEIGSTLRLLDEVGRANVRTYWQPHQDMPDGEALDTLRAALPRTSTIHVFSWWPRSERLPLAERTELWEAVFAILADHGADRDALLEFVPGDDPALLQREADTLRTLITAGEELAR
jgi:sugar phosphate isomerase/epimerase